uniref:BCL2 interacting protein like n=1 Tax=Hucho hucho TaxID=62062 RepID=A0A4W5LYC1_9TELE
MFDRHFTNKTLLIWHHHYCTISHNACVCATPPAPPTSLALSGNPIRKKRLVAPTLSLTLSRTDSADRSVKSGDTGYSAAALSPDEDDTELDINLEALETPSDSESCNFPDSMHELEWEGERRNKNWSGRVREETRTGVDRERGQELERFCVAGQEYHVNMSVLEPYLQVLSHGGETQLKPTVKAAHNWPSVVWVWPG